MENENPPSRLLLVEGESDVAVALHLWRRLHHGDDPPFTIEAANGITGILERIEAEVDAPGRTHLGFVIDADDDPDERWAALKGKLQLASISTGDLSTDGLRVRGTMPKAVGVWMMPDNEQAGELEDFLREMIPQADLLWPVTEACIKEIMKVDRRFATGEQLRAEIHSWLAVQDRPGMPGPAIKSGLLSIDGDLAQRYGRWMERIFISI